jgi:hypothetical protein
VLRRVTDIVHYIVPYVAAPVYEEEEGNLYDDLAWLHVMN